MTSFANPAGHAVAAAPAYVRALLDLLGPRDPLAVLAELMPWLETRVRGLARVGMHSERGPQTVSLMLRLMAAHDLVHRRQLERILAGTPAGTRP